MPWHCDSLPVTGNNHPHWHKVLWLLLPHISLSSLCSIMGAAGIYWNLSWDFSHWFLSSCVCVPPALMAPSGPRPGMQQQEGWVGPASAPPIGAPGPGHQNAIQGRTGPSGTPMRPNSQPGPRQMMQSPIMPNSKSAVYQKNTYYNVLNAERTTLLVFRLSNAIKLFPSP